MSVDTATGGREAFLRELHDTYAQPLLRVARRVTGGDTQWAEDVVQETMLRAWRHVDTLRAGGYPNLLPWLATVARRIAINNRRRSFERPAATDEILLDGAPVADHAEQTVNRAVVALALARLPGSHRDVIVGLYLRDLPLADVARALRLPLGTVKSRAHYALRAMRATLHGAR
jgi:RNA polymerase sigma-70 factor (ECF subfamily)